MVGPMRRRDSAGQSCGADAAAGDRNGSLRIDLDPPASGLALPFHPPLPPSPPPLPFPPPLQLLPPVLSAFSDPDARVRYSACEAMYNMAKVARASCVVHVNAIFDGLFKLSADTDVQVRGGKGAERGRCREIVEGGERGVQRGECVKAVGQYGCAGGGGRSVMLACRLGGAACWSGWVCRCCA